MLPERRASMCSDSKTPMPTPATTPDIAAVSDDDSSSDSSPHVEMS